jgi:hypothetical protein
MRAMPNRSIRTILLAAAALLALAAPAVAAPPPETVRYPVHNPVQDNGEHCGFPVKWDIHMDVTRTRWRDDAGNLTHETQFIREENTLHNLDTGKTLRDGPVTFVRNHFYRGGVRQYTVDSGLMVNISGHGERMLDTGLVKFRVGPDGRWDILKMIGHHPVYRVLDGQPFIGVMRAFCGVLD